MIGELAALLAAATWAVSAILYRGALPHYGAKQANLYKTTSGALLIWVTLLVWPGALAAVEWHASPLATLAISGVIGLAIGDTFYFRALQILGIHRAVLLYSLSPVFTLALAFSFLGEQMSWVRLAGALVTVAGVYLVLGQHGADAPVDARRPVAGVLCALAAALCQSLGILLSKAGLVDVGALAGTGVRLTAGSLALLVPVWARGEGSARDLMRPEAHRRLLPAVIVGTYIGVFLMMFAIEHANAGIVGVLLSTTPLFSLCLAGILDGHWPPLRSWLGSALAVLGIALILM